MGNAEKGVSVSILGTRFSVVSDRDEAYVRELAEFVDERLGKLVRERSAPLQRTLLLGALSIADELFRERDRRRSLMRELKDRSERLIDSLGETE